MKKHNLVKAYYFGVICLVFAAFLAISCKCLYAEGTDRRLIFPSDILNLNCYVRLGNGWENFRDIHPQGASFGIPLSLSASGSADGGISFSVDGNGNIYLVDASSFNNGLYSVFSHHNSAYTSIWYTIGSNAFPAYYQLSAKGLLTSSGGVCGTSEASTENATIVSKSGVNYGKTYRDGWTITVNFEESCNSCQTCEAGTVTPSIGSLDCEIGLGKSVMGASKASLHAESPSAELATPNLLTFKLAPDAVTMVMSGTNRRQIRTQNSLVDIQVLNGFSYEMRFYALGSIGVLDATGFYQLTGQPEKTVRIENPDASASTFNRLQISEIVGTQTRVSLYTYTALTKAWSLSRPDSLGSENISMVETTGTDGSVLTRASTILKLNANGTVSTKTKRTTKHFAWGWETIQEIKDPDGSALTTNYEFYTDSTQVGNYSRLMQMTDSKGHWERYAYDSAGFETTRVIQYLDNDITTQDSDNRVITTTRSSTAPQRTIIETIRGQEVARSYRVLSSEGTSNAINVIKEIVCVHPGAAWDAPENLVTITKKYDPINGGVFRNEILSVRRPDGTMTLSTYSQGSSQRTVVTNEGEPDATGASIVNGTRTEVITDLAGNELSRTVTDIQSSLVLKQGVTTTQDSYGRPTRIDYSDSTFELFQYGCCGLEQKTDREGITTHYTYDALKRLETESKGGITTIFAYNAAGNLLSQTRQGSDGSKYVVDSSNYDLAGRKTSGKYLSNYTETTGADGKTTSTTTLLDSSTQIEVTHGDGRLVSISGSAAHPVQYEYGIATDGQQFTKEIKVGDNGEVTEWIKTYKDMAGRVVKKEYPDGAAEQFFYNNSGQLVRQMDPDMVTRLYTYNGQGELTHQAVDLNGNNQIDDTDQVTVTDKSVVSAHDTIVTRTVVSQATENGYVTTSITDETEDGHKRWETHYGLPTSISKGYDGNGGYIETTILPDQSQIIATYSNGLLMSQIKQMSNGTVISSGTSTYDPHGRLDTQVDNRTGTETRYTYVDDNLHSVSTGGMTTVYGYNALRQQTSATLPGTNRTIGRSYLPTGELTGEWGTAAYPVTYQRDSQGRTKYMITASGTTTFIYDPARGWLTDKLDAANKGAHYQYKPSGRPWTRKWARGSITTYSYDAAGNPSGTTYSDSTPAVGVINDQRGRPALITDAQGTHTLQSTDDGRLVSDTISGDDSPWKGIAMTNSYDGLLRRNGFTATSSKPVRVRGQSTINTNVLTSFGIIFDDASRVDTVTYGNQSATYAYAPTSSLVQNIFFKQGGDVVVTATNNHDGLNRLRTISFAPQSGGTNAYTYDYNDEGQRFQVTREDNTIWKFDYNSRSEVVGGTKKFSDGTAILGYQFGYTFDDIGNRLTATDNGRTAIYAPNSLNQYTSRTVPGYVNITGKANDTTVVTVNGQSTTRQSNGSYHKELAVDNGSTPVWLSTTVAGTKDGTTAQLTGNRFVPQTPESYDYDLDGNLTGDGRWIYTWDAENRLISMETKPAAVSAGAPQKRLTFAYDYQGRRVSKKVEIWNGTAYSHHHTLLYVYDGWNLAAELLADSGQLIRSYVWGKDVSGGQSAGGIGGLLFIHQQAEDKIYAVGYDGNGNVSNLFDMANSGTVDATYEYSPFGELVRTSGIMAAVNPFQFSTKYTDAETGLAYYGYRYYNPIIGKWISRDPLCDEVFFELYEQSLSQKNHEDIAKEFINGSNIFIQNNPVNHIDRLGLVRIIDEENSFSPSMWSDRTINVSWSVTHNNQTITQGHVQITPRSAYGNTSSIGYATGAGRPGDTASFAFVCRNSNGQWNPNGWIATATIIDPWGIQQEHLNRRRELQQQGRIPAGVNLSSGGGVSSLLYRALSPAQYRGRLYAQ